MIVTDSIKYIGVNDKTIDLFEGQYAVPNGMCYNSYYIEDLKTAVLDTAAEEFTNEWLSNIEEASKGKAPDYLIVQHMEPDHSASIKAFVEKYPKTEIVSSTKAFRMMKNFFGEDISINEHPVKEGDELSLGEHVLTFVAAPMVHWPEVIMTYDKKDKALFTADAFGTFGALDSENQDWVSEARRYYIGIVGKYGIQVQKVLAKTATLDVEILCPLHGPVHTDRIPKLLELYNLWSSYIPETEGCMVAYTSVYGHTKDAAILMAEELKKAGAKKVVTFDLARSDMSEAVAAAFQYSHIVLATTTYNGEIFPFMREFIDHLTERGFKNRKIGFIENGSWGPRAAKVMREKLEGSKNLQFFEPVVTIKSAMTEKNREDIKILADRMLNGEPESKEKENKKGFICGVCGWIYEGETLPKDITCPICKAGYDAFKPL